MIKLSNNKELVDRIQELLEENKEKFGKRYCPCAIQKTEDTVCMCKEFRDMEYGECHCGLFIKTKE